MVKPELLESSVPGNGGLTLPSTTDATCAGGGVGGFSVVFPNTIRVIPLIKINFDPLSTYLSNV